MKISVVSILVILVLSACGSDGGGGNGSGGGATPPTPRDDPTVTSQVAIEGGDVVLDGIVSLSFGSNTFSVPTDVTITEVFNVYILNFFLETTDIFESRAIWINSVRVNIGNVPVDWQSSPIRVDYTIPPAMVTETAAYEQVDIYLVSENSGGAEDDVVVAMLDSVATAPNILTTYLAPEDFSGYLRNDGTYEAAMLLAISPDKTRISYDLLTDNPPIPVEPSFSSSSGTLCPANRLTCPVSTGCEDLGPAFQKSRALGKTERARPHYGQDYFVPLGTPIVAAKEGRVISARSVSNFGNTVVLRHVDGGRTLYAHLSQIEVEESDGVVRGQLIGYSGNTGFNSDADLLHFEYVPEGGTIATKERIDPHFCVANPDPQPDPFVGTWDITETVSTNDPSCPDDAMYSASVSVTGLPDLYDVALPFGTVTANALGGLLYLPLTTVFDEDGGQRTTNGAGRFHADGYFTGKFQWTWTDGISSCSGESVLTGQPQA